MHWGSTCKCKAAMSSRQGLNPVNQKEVDQKMFELDGTDNKGKLGANAILAVSMATSKVLRQLNAFLHWSFPRVQYAVTFTSRVTLLLALSSTRNHACAHAYIPQTAQYLCSMINICMVLISIKHANMDCTDNVSAHAFACCSRCHSCSD